MSRMRRPLVGLFGLVLIATLAGCTSASSALRERAATTVQSRQLVAASATASITGKPVSLVVPSGRVDLVLTAPSATVPAEQVDGARPLVAAHGTTLVGVSWLLQRAAFPNSPNRQLDSPYKLFGVPQRVRLGLVTDGTRRAIPGVGNLTTAGRRLRTAVWIDVPAGVTSWQFALDYDGVTQTVDARTGKVTPGVAAPLYRPLPLDAEGTCSLGANALTSCLISYAVGFPYVNGAGWAPAGKTWVLLEVTTDSQNTDVAQSVTVGGAKPHADVGDQVTPFAPFLVAKNARTLAIRGTATAREIRGSTKQATLTGRLQVPTS